MNCSVQDVKMSFYIDIHIKILAALYAEERKDRSRETGVGGRKP